MGRITKKKFNKFIWGVGFRNCIVSRHVISINTFLSNDCVVDVVYVFLCADD